MTEIDASAARIMRALSADGRLTNQELAERTGLSPSACSRRVRALEQAGVIRGYRAVLDPVAMGRGFVALLTVGLNDHSTRSQTEFERAMLAARDVVECHNITGAVEYILRVECADLPAYKRFHADILGQLPQVNAITTHVVMASPKDTRG